MPHVYILILNYKKWMDVASCLESLMKPGEIPFTVIVIDNDSQNKSLELLIEWAKQKYIIEDIPAESSTKAVNPRISYRHVKSKNFIRPSAGERLPQLLFVQNEENKGFAAGINTVLKHLIEEDAFVWLLNPDMTVAPDALEKLCSFAASSHPNSIIGTVIKYFEQPSKVHLYAGGIINFNAAAVKLISNKSSLAGIDYISGGSLFTHAYNYKKLGLLPEEYFLYWEETDWCYRAKQAGYQLLLCEQAVCFDKVSTSIGKNYLSDFYYTRNGLLFLKKFKPGKVAIAIFFTFFRLLKRLFLFQFNRAHGMYCGMVSFLKKSYHAHQ